MISRDKLTRPPADGRVRSPDGPKKRPRVPRAFIGCLLVVIVGSVATGIFMTYAVDVRGYSLFDLSGPGPSD